MQPEARHPPAAPCALHSCSTLSLWHRPEASTTSVPLLQGATVGALLLGSALAPARTTAAATAGERPQHVWECADESLLYLAA